MAPPNILPTPSAYRAAAEDARARGLTVALVPTMGALHDGHLALVEEARRHASWVAVSIFVNPTQFGPNEDFARYPRDLDGDVRKLGAVGADAVFAPDATAMYPAGDQTRVRVGTLGESLCGPFRPGHFEGVATVVAKLFAVTGPGVAVFGKKDYQQLAILRRVATDLFFPIRLVGHAIVREKDGLAMSSRNAYLTPAERARALGLSRGLDAAWRAFAAGERDAATLARLVRTHVESAASAIDYVTIADADSLAPLADGTRAGERALVAVACRIGSTRLIDNVVLGEDPSPLAASGARPAPLVG